MSVLSYFSQSVFKELYDVLFGEFAIQIGVILLEDDLKTFVDDRL
jgi:hypothetical protein